MRMMCGMGQIVTGENTYVPTPTLRLAVSLGRGAGAGSGTGVGAPGPEVSALLLDGSGRARGDADLVFDGQPAHPSGSVQYLGVNEHGQWLELRLALIDPEIDRVLVVASRDGVPFSAQEAPVMEAFAEDGQSVLRYAVKETAAGTALVLGAFQRGSGGWEFAAMGQGYASGLAGLVSHHGIEVADEAAAPALAAAPAASPVPAQASPVPHSVGARVPDTAASAHDWSFGVDFAPHVVQGRGKEVVDTGRQVPPGPALLHVQCPGEGYLSLSRLGPDDTYESSILSGRVEDFQGSAPIEVPRGRPLRLEIEDNRPWTVRILPLTAARRLEGTLRGRGPEVFLHTGGPADLHLDVPSGEYVSVRCHEVANRSELPDYGDSIFSKSGPFRVILPLVQGPLLVTIENAGAEWEARLERLTF